MRILFAGSPEIALPSLKLLASESLVSGVLTSPDRPAGRGKKMKPPPVKVVADELGLPVLQPERLDGKARLDVEALKPDIMAVFAYSKIFGPRFLSLFKSGAVNVHPSLLPKYRGPAPIPAAILAGDEITGVTVQCVGLKMDAGDILLQQEIRIGERETAGELANRVAPVSAELLLRAVRMIEDDSATPFPQDDREASYSGKISKEDGRIDWMHTARQIALQVRAYNPWPMAYTTFGKLKLSICRAVFSWGDEERFSNETPGKVIGVDTTEGILIKTFKGILLVEELQLQSHKALGWKAFLNGTPGFTGSILGGE